MSETGCRPTDGELLAKARERIAALEAERAKCMETVNELAFINGDWANQVVALEAALANTKRESERIRADLIVMFSGVRVSTEEFWQSVERLRVYSRSGEIA